MYRPDNFMREAIESHNMDRIHGALVALLQSDPAFMTTELEDAISYLQNNEHINPFTEGALDPTVDKEDRASWNQRYFAEAVTRLRHEFSYERYRHVVEVSKFTHRDLRARQEAERYAAQNKKAARGGTSINPTKRRRQLIILGLVLLLLAALISIVIRVSSGRESSPEVSQTATKAASLIADTAGINVHLE